jgi:hypothetical protein
VALVARAPKAIPQVASTQTSGERPGPAPRGAAHGLRFAIASMEAAGERQSFPVRSRMGFA